MTTQNDDLARYLQQTGMATDAQIAAARALHPVPLAEALVRQGAITSAQREAVEKRLGEKRGAAQQLGAYRLLRKLGEGGMGAVYLAEDLRHSRRVAIKVLPKRLADEREYLERFRRESEAARALDHPNIVRAFETGEERGFHYYVMEFCQGVSLRSRLEREKVLDPMESTRIVAQVAEGLGHAHAKGILHRDVKPDNVMLTPDGVAKILDLGLAKNLMTPDSNFRTMTGVAIGTPHYLSPEQARGQKEIDGRADIYSLGATFYTLVTGVTPFQGGTIFEIIQKHLTEPLADPRDRRPSIPEGVVHVIRRMMAKSPDDRYRDCAELVIDLRLLQEGRAPDGPRIDAALSSIALPQRRRRRARFAIPGAAGLGAILLVIALLARKKTPETHADSEASTVDLLALVDPVRDHVNASWRREGAALVSPPTGDNFGNGSARFFVRAEWPEEYDLEVVVDRSSGEEDLVLGVIGAGHPCGIALDGWSGRRSGFCLDGRWQPMNEGAVLVAGRSNRIVCSVRRSGLTVSVNGLRVLGGTDFGRLSLPVANRVPDDRALVVGSVRSVFRLTRLTLSPVKS